MTLIKTCAVCGKQFETKAKNVTCSSECRAIRKAEQDRTAVKRHHTRGAALSKWLTIPDAPKYEINAKLQVRNKRTGHLIKLYFDNRTKAYRYFLYGITGRLINRSSQSLRDLACAALQDEKFLPIPSLNCKYEINKAGFVRNAKTKKLLKQHKTSTGKIWYEPQSVEGRKKYTRRFVDSLLAEVFGIKNTNRQSPVPVVLSKGHRRIFFESIRAAARFFATQYFYQVGTFASRMKKRKSIIEDWNVTYLVDDNNDYSRGLNLEAHRQKRVYDKTVERQQQGNHHAQN